MGKRLAEGGKLEKFNKQFQDNVDRGICRKLTKEAMDAYKGAINYISIHG
jgi:hypothetical protein